MFRIFRLTVICCLIGFGLLSCVTLSSDPAPPLADITRSDMEASLSNKDLRNGFNAWSRARIHGDLPSDYLIDYASRLFGMFVSQDVAAPAKETISLARLSRAQDLLLFSGDVKPDETAKLNSALASEYSRLVQVSFDQGLNQLAVLFAIAHPIVLQDKVLLKKLLATANEIPNLWAVQRLEQLSALDKPTANLTSALPEIDPTAILKACVTVWVDRGVKVDHGMGMADRVIGSAFFVEKDGYLLTNYHVISSEVDPEYKGFSKLYIRLGSSSSEKIPAKVVGWDPVFDLALLKTEIQAPALIPLSNERGSASGTRVLAFGSPGGLDNTVTAGIVSAQGRRFLPMGEILQIDAPVNPGNSGGPLLTSSGVFMGIVFAGIPQFQGVNFTVPAFWIAGLLPQLFQGGKVLHPRLGIQLFEYRNEVRIAYVAPGSPAFLLGISAGAILKTVNGMPINNITEGYRILSGLMPGQLASLEWLEAGKNLLEFSAAPKKIQAMIMMDERPEHPLENHIKAGLDLKLLIPLFGMRVSELSSGSAPIQLKIEEVIPGSSADESGFAAGDTMQVFGWVYEPKNRVAILQLQVSRRSQGFFPQSMQLASYTDIQDLL